MNHTQPSQLMRHNVLYTIFINRALQKFHFLGTLFITLRFRFQRTLHSPVGSFAMFLTLAFIDRSFQKLLISDLKESNKALIARETNSALLSSSQDFIGIGHII